MVPCVWFDIELSMAFGGGDGVRYPPPLSGGSKLNNLTCGVEKKKFGHPRCTSHFTAIYNLRFVSS